MAVSRPGSLHFPDWAERVLLFTLEEQKLKRNDVNKD